VGEQARTDELLNLEAVDDFADEAGDFVGSCLSVHEFKFN